MEKAEIQALIRKAFEGQQFAYTPYSHFRVGAALRAKDGRVYTGCNIENAGYTPTNCAEQGEVNTLVTGPCGVCRQALYEFGGDALTVIMAKTEDDYIVTTLGALLPYGFGPANLEK